MNDELLGVKQEINKKIRDYNNLKFAYIKLDEENKKNVKVIEEIISACGRSTSSDELNKMNPQELENEIRNILTLRSPSDGMIVKLRDVKINLINYISIIKLKIIYKYVRAILSIL